MKTVRAITEWDELEALLLEVGPILSIADSAEGLGVSRRRAYEIAAAGMVRVYAVFGTYYVPFSDIRARRTAHSVNCTDCEVVGKHLIAA